MLRENRVPATKSISTSVQQSNTNNAPSLQTKPTVASSVSTVSGKTTSKKDVRAFEVLGKQSSAITTNTDFMKICQKVDVAGKVPSTRFGHTMVLVSPTKAILFGGAVGDTKTYKITNETFSFNILTKIWNKLDIKGENLPSPRAAHASCSNESLEMFLYGGSELGGALANDDLFVLDLKEGDDSANWKLINVTSKTPGKRYGHSIVYSQPYLIVFGGNIGAAVTNDVWIINTSDFGISKVNEWSQLVLSEDSVPLPRVYHSAAVCTKGNAKGMMLIFGGRDSTENALNDTWGLRRHRNEKWDWAKAPTYKTDFYPKHRFNHNIFFVGTLMVITGGRSKNISDIIPTEIYDTETSDWSRFGGIGLYRHIAFRKDSTLFIYGGFENSNPNFPIEKFYKLNLSEYLQSNPGIQKKADDFITYQKERESKIKDSNSNTNSNPVSSSSKALPLSPLKPSTQVPVKGDNSSASAVVAQNTQPENRKFRLASKAVVLKINENISDDGLISKVEIEKLMDESKRIGYNNIGQFSNISNKRVFNEKLINKFIDVLFHPFDWYSQEVEQIHQKLPFTRDEIDNLIAEASRVIAKENTLVSIKSPAKVFGNLFGQYNDLMRFFESYGHPTDDNSMGDIHLFHYVFLGDYVDRGMYSLEVILLLLALKVKYPENINLIRGHHEDAQVNISNGFGEECEKRLSDNIKLESSIFIKINNLFQLLPLGAIIDNKILCVHGGIGTSISKLSDISSIKRPVKVTQDVTTLEQQMVLDLLWSEYSNDVSEVSINEERDNSKTGSILKFGKDRLFRFIQDNNLMLVITSHQFVQEGVKAFADERLISIYSVTNYLDKYNNMGGMILINKNSTQIQPKLIDVYKYDKKSYRQTKNPSPVRK